MATSNPPCLSAISVGLLVLIAGCGEPKPELPPCYPTKGVLTYNGKPAKGAVVTFWPLPLNTADWKTIKPQAMVEVDGSYQPNSYDLKDGAMIGEYAVTVLWTGESGGPGPDLLKGKYSNPAKPVLKVTITEGENVIPPIDLKGPAVNATVKGVDGL